MMSWLMLCLTGNKEARDGVFFSSLFSSQSRLDGLEKCFSSKLLSVGSANGADLKLILLSAALRTSFKRFVRYELSSSAADKQERLGRGWTWTRPASSLLQLSSIVWTETDGACPAAGRLIAAALINLPY